MRILRGLMLLLALVLFAACKHEATEQARQGSSTTPQASVTLETTSPHPNQVTVSMGKISSEAARLNPRIAEAYSLATVTLERTAAAPAGFPGAPEGFPGASEPQNESPPPGNEMAGC